VDEIDIKVKVPANTIDCLLTAKRDKEAIDQTIKNHDTSIVIRQIKYLHNIMGLNI
jgi:hypothetical protein